MSLIIYADGAASMNPIGPSAAATVVVENGKIIERYGKHLGIGSCNVAEYYGLLFALSLASKHRIANPVIRMDSTLVVKQVNNEWKCKKHDLIPLRDLARRLITGFENVQLGWVPREQNQLADDASKDALYRVLRVPENTEDVIYNTIVNELSEMNTKNTTIVNSTPDHKLF